MNFPVYLDWVADLFGSVSQVAAKSWQKITEVELDFKFCSEIISVYFQAF